MKKAISTGFGVLVMIVGLGGFVFLPVILWLLVINYVEIDSRALGIIGTCAAIELCFVNAGLLKYKDSKEVVDVISCAILPIFIVLGAFLLSWPVLITKHFGYAETSAVSVVAEIVWIAALFIGLVAVAVHEPKKS